MKTQGTKKPQATGTLALISSSTQVKADVGEDLIVSTAQVIETLSEAQAMEGVIPLIEQVDENYYRVGGYLSTIKAHGWTGGYANFKELVEKKFELHIRKAEHLIHIYRSLVDSKVPWDMVKDLGWTKLRILARILTQDNATYWAGQASQMTSLQLEESVKAAQNAGKEGKEPAVKSEVTTLTFKVHKDQKETIRDALNSVKDEIQTEYDTVALEQVCLAFLGGQFEVHKPAVQPPQAKIVPPTAKDMKELMAQFDYDEILGIFGEVFPDINITVEI